MTATPSHRAPHPPPVRSDVHRYDVHRPGHVVPPPGRRRSRRMRVGPFRAAGGGGSAAAGAPRTSNPAPPTPAPPASCAGCSRSRCPPGRRCTGVPIGRHMHTAEPVGLDPAQWLRTGLVSNTGVWVQGQPGIGKSSITKRLLVGLVGFGMTAVIPGDVKGEYTPLIDALGGAVWRIGRGRHALNPLDPGPLARRPARRGRHRTRPDRRDPPRPAPIPARSPADHRAPRRGHRHRTPPARRRARPRRHPPHRPPDLAASPRPR